MLNLLHSQHGVTLIELIIGVIIVGILSAIGAPALSNWIQNGQIRTTAEAIQNGLQLARAEAVHRNGLVLFHLTTTTDNACALSTISSNWVVSFDNPAGLCASSKLNDAFSVDDTVNNPAPRIIQVRSSTEGSRNAIVAADQSTVSFNGLGRTTNVAGTVTIAISNTTGGACAPAGPMRCLNVVATSGGQIRMCNPALPSTDPQGC